MATLSAARMTEINKAHSKRIRKLLREFLKSDPAPKPCVPPVRDADGDEGEDDMARWRRRRHAWAWQDQADRDEMSDLLRMEDGQSRKELTIDQIMDSADRQHTAVLEKPWYVSEESNRDRLMASHILENLDELLSTIPVRCKEFMLLPEQRLAIIAMTQPLPKESFIKCEITRESMTHITGHRARKQPFSVQFSLEGLTLPTWSIADFCTGSGKTIMAIQAALHLLCNRQSWKGLTDNYHNLLRDRLRDTHSGLIKLDHMDNARLAKLAIMFVPGTVLDHWFRTCKSAVHGIKDIYGSQIDVLVWKGNSRDYSIQEAYQCGKPVLWVKTMEADSLRDTRATPDIGYAVRIYDELNAKMKTRYDQPESTPLFNYIVGGASQSSHSPSPLALPVLPVLPVLSPFQSSRPHAHRPRPPSRPSPAPPPARPATRSASRSATTSAPWARSSSTWRSRTTAKSRRRSPTSARCACSRRQSSCAASSPAASSTTCRPASSFTT